MHLTLIDVVCAAAYKGYYFMSFPPLLTWCCRFCCLIMQLSQPRVFEGSLHIYTFARVKLQHFVQ